MQRSPPYVTRTAADACCNKTDGSRPRVLIDVESCQAEQRTEEEAVIKFGLHLNEINGQLILVIEQEPCVCVFGIFGNYRTLSAILSPGLFSECWKEAVNTFSNLGFRKNNMNNMAAFTILWMSRSGTMKTRPVVMLILCPV